MEASESPSKEEAKLAAERAATMAARKMVVDSDDEDETQGNSQHAQRRFGAKQHSSMKFEAGAAVKIQSNHDERAEKSSQKVIGLQRACMRL